MIYFDKNVCGHLETALGREWLETNGIGGFACGTLAGANTRRYHGLLTAALSPPGRRTLLLAKLEESLLVGQRRIDLSTNEYSGAVHPKGYEYLTGFRQDPFPTFTFEVADIKLEKSVLMPHGRNAVQIEYRIVQSPPETTLQLEVRPLIAFRDYHSTTHENNALDPGVEIAPGLASVQPYSGLPRLYLAHMATMVQKEGYWYRNFLYRVERERGLDFQEDLFNPLCLVFDLGKSPRAVVIASPEPFNIDDAVKIRKQEQKRRKLLLATVPNNDPLVAALTLAADQFLVRRDDDWTVIAGYPWFTDWGRDTMISLPGLTLFTGKAAIAKSILANFARHSSMGMIPNRFLDSGDSAEFNNVDGTLWFFEAARAYAAVTGDYEFLLNELYPVFEAIIGFHIQGTRYNIKMADNGLLTSGAPGVQLTWMDAKIANWVVTPRTGKPVEIQALWYNALKIMEDLAGRLGDERQRKRYATLSALALWTFNRIFWNKDKNCLYDVVNGVCDASIRPNQILAVSLHHSMLSHERACAVVETVERELLTPVGLRTLSRSHPDYRGSCRGDQASRDSAYHQGTVWPWLLGSYLTALIRVRGGTPEARKCARQLLQGLEDHLAEAGIGQLSEIFDGDFPHRPCGCFAQAWSVGELLRALRQDILPSLSVNGHSDQEQNLATV
jgi:predicted glycogen debranching enzyme